MKLQLDFEEKRRVFDRFPYDYFARNKLGNPEYGSLKEAKEAGERFVWIETDRWLQTFGESIGFSEYNLETGAFTGNSHVLDRWDEQDDDDDGEVIWL
jgi:hypothetical protein